MPKQKESEKLIPKIYRRKFEDMAMLFFVEGQRKIIPAMTIEQGLYNFYQYIGEDEFNIESAIVIFSQLRAEFIDLKYNEFTKKNK